MKKRVIGLLLVFSMLVSMLPFGIFAADVTALSGNGTAEAPYEIGSADELVFAAEKMNASDSSYVGKYYVLTADVDLSSVANFPMISKFTGTFDGRGHTVSNLTIEHSGSSYYRSAFIDQNYGTVCDLTFDNATINALYDRMGSGVAGASVVVGENCQDGVISCVTVKNSTVNAPKVTKAAGITSMNSRAGNTTGVNIATVRNCAVINTTLIGGPRAEGNAYGLMMGGIAGYQGSSTIENCYISGLTMKAASETASPFHAGYICGYAAGGTIDGCVVASGSIERMASEAEQKFNTLKLGGICCSQNSYYGALAPVHGNLIDLANADSPNATALKGTDTSADTLKLQSTYEALGWDFYVAWKMVDSAPALMAPSERFYLTLEGSGTEEDPYLINNAADLVNMAELTNSADKRVVGMYFKLTADIDMSSVSSFPMINSFTGTLDGAGYAIKNLTVNHDASASYYRSAFIDLNYGTVCDITFDNATINALYDRMSSGVAGAAVVVGENCQDGVISCVTVKNSTVNAPKVTKAAGITSMNSRSSNTTGVVIGTVKNCAVINTTLIGGPRAAGNIYGLQMGGIAGYSGASIIENCYVSGLTMKAASETTSPFHAGMICGYAAGGSIDGNVAASGSIVRMAAEEDWQFTSLKLGGICPTQNTYYGSLAPVKGNLIDTANAPAGTTVLTGTAVTTDALKLQSTYTDLGWNFSSVWKMENDIPVLMAPSERVFIPLTGSGTEADPYLITKADELVMVAELLNSENSVAVGKAFALAADIDLTDINFTPIDNFSGILDGRNHTLKNLTIDDTVTANMGGEYRVAFIRTNTGTVKNIVFDSPVVKTTALSTGGNSGAAVIVGDNAHGSLVSHCVVTNATVYAPHLPKAGGIAVMNARTNTINATISHCVFEGTLSFGPRTGSYGPMAGGIAAYSATSTIEYCLVKADINYLPNDSITSTVVNAAMICGYSNYVTYRANVAYAGSINIDSSVATQNTGILYGKDAFGQQDVLTNIACDEITVNGVPVTFTDKKNGISRSSDELIHKDIYETIGWDFKTTWKMNDASLYPDRYPILGTVAYSDDNINMVTAVITGDDGCSIGFTWHYLADKNMRVSVSEDKMFNESLIFIATSSGNVYKAEATGLSANTKYYYRVEGDSKVSEVGTFTTAGADAPFTFIAVSDTEAANLDEALKADSTIESAQEIVSDAKFVLHSGDFTDSTRGEEGWKDLLYNSTDTLVSMPIVPTKGEEDAALFNYFNIKNSYYSFDYENAHIIVLDTTEDAESCLSEEQIAWLKADAASTDKDWIILSMHKGPYTSGTSANDADVKALRELFIGELDGIGIDLVIQGHDHIMGHTYDLKDGSKTEMPVYTETINGKRFDYTMDAEGIIYMMTGATGAQTGTQMSADDLDEYIMKFARSDGRGATPTFSAITVEKDRLTVGSYEIHTNNAPSLIEGFGIDRAVSGVEALISEGNYSLAREAYNKLSGEQKAQVENYNILVANEGNADAMWTDSTASERRSILVRNDTDLDFTNAPVLIKLENAPSDSMAFYTAKGEAIPYEIESYNSNGISNVWVNVPKLCAESVTALWVYFGGEGADNTSEAVWDETYSLVEHFSDNNYLDSTGKETGTANGTLTETDNNGDKGVSLDGSSNIVYDSIGDDYMEISVSAVVSYSADSLTDAGIVSKYAANDPSGNNAYLLGVKSSGELHSYIGCMWWRNNSPRKKDYVTEILSDGQPHLVTVAYDGFTVQTYIDGKVAKWESVFIESTAFFDPNLPTTVGSYSSYLGGPLSGGFKGNIYDVQINGARMTEQWESFRYSNYFGDSVTVGEGEANGDFVLNADGATHSISEAGKQLVMGVVTKDSALVAEVNGNSFDLGTVSAGEFAVYVPVSGTSEQRITLTATADGESKAVEFILNTEDTVAPEKPVISEDSGVLSAETSGSDKDELSAEFHVSENISLIASNTKVAVGSTANKTPSGINPKEASYSISSTLRNAVTVEDGTNPYQIIRVTITEEQSAMGGWRFSWHGTCDRQLHAYGYDFVQGAWIKLCSTEGTGELSMNIEMSGTQYVENNIVYLMIFRGMGEEISELDSFIPEKGEYDFTMFWNSDTQYMSQFTPELVYHQYQWIADNYDDMNGVITFNTGDLANRSNLNYEYNWEVVDESYEIFEEESIPYTFCWGNHDIGYDGQPNERRYYQTYFPTSRLEGNAGDWEVSFAPDSVTGTTTRAMAYKNTIDGAKIMILSLAYASRLTESDLAWAEDMVKNNSDYTVILITHTYSSDTEILVNNISTRIVDPYENVKLVLNGHLDGVSTYKMTNGGFAVLQDYQGEYGAIKYGGDEFMRLIQFDVENDLIYFNTYSPLTGETLSPYGTDSDPEAEGLYQKNGDEFALSVELNGDKTRSFTTSSLAMASSADAFAYGVTVTEGEIASIVPEGLDAGGKYCFYVVLSDSTGNSTVSDTKLFTATAHEHSYTAVTTEPNCTEEGVTEYTCICGDSYTEVIPATGHSFGAWYTTVEPTTTSVGEERRDCANCDAYETNELPMIEVDVNAPVLTTENYTIKLTNADTFTYIRYAAGIYTTASEIKNAEGCVTLGESKIASFTTDGVCALEMVDGGYYSVWVKTAEGKEYIFNADLTVMYPEVSTYGVTITLKNLYGVKDYFICPGDYDNYSDIKANYLVLITANKIGTAHEYKYVVPNPGVYTIYIRYADSQRPATILKTNCVVQEPTFNGNGLQFTVSDLDDVKVIRTAYGEYNTPGEVKRAQGQRSFSAKDRSLKGKTEFTIQYRSNGVVTVAVVYNHGYEVMYTYDVQQKVPSFVQNGNTVTFGQLDGLNLIRYAEGVYETSNQIKNAGSTVLKTADIVDGFITVTLDPGTYTFCVQYLDESYNYYVVTVE